MCHVQVRRWLIALTAGVGIAASASAGAEAIYSSSDHARPSVNLADSTVRMQLCARKGVDGSCLDGQTSQKALELLPPSPPADGEPPPVISLHPPVIDDLPSVRETVPLVPIIMTPNSVAVPEPGGLSLAALGAMILVTGLPKQR